MFMCLKNEAEGTLKRVNSQAISQAKEKQQKHDFDDELRYLLV